MNGIPEFKRTAASLICAFILGSITGYYAGVVRQKTPLPLSSEVTLVVLTPGDYADAVRDAMGKAGAGTMGNYAYCSFSYKGVGRFIAGSNAHPTCGTIGTLESVEEEYIQARCAIDKLDAVIAAIKKVHPYDEPGIDIVPLYEFKNIET
jgi:hypothetical protein